MNLVSLMKGGALIFLGIVLGVALIQTIENLYSLGKHRRLTFIYDGEEISEEVLYLGKDDKRIWKFLLQHAAVTMCVAALFGFLLMKVL